MEKNSQAVIRVLQDRRAVTGSPKVTRGPEEQNLHAWKVKKDRLSAWTSERGNFSTVRREETRYNRLKS